MLESNTVKEGGVIKVRINSNEPLKAAEVTFMGKTYQAFYRKYDVRESEYMCMAFIPVPLGTNGKKDLKTRWLLRNDDEAIDRQKVRVVGLKSRETQLSTGMVNDNSMVRLSNEGRIIYGFQNRITPARFTMPFIMPVKAVQTGGFGDKRTYDGGKAGWRHKGLDLAAPKGTKVHASNNGTVMTASTTKMYGIIVIIDHGAGIYTMYFHLNRVFVKKGMNVKKGDIIAEVGNTGISTGPHLHWQVNLHKVPVNPGDLLADF
ncbi:MAG: M23 family metallopeptidase [Spirochaetia bacterium]|nr:M23 family metallopeptidase [Spirochaetia bacterium]